jgi:hypothetical protein
MTADVLASLMVLGFVAAPWVGAVILGRAASSSWVDGDGVTAAVWAVDAVVAAGGGVWVAAVVAGMGWPA